MLVVPGSARVRLQAEAEGLDKVFTEAGAEWRGAGCSMCLGMNPDQLAPGERSASTSNRNFEGRQGKGGRTHLVSPARRRRHRRARHAVQPRPTSSPCEGDPSWTRSPPTPASACRCAAATSTPTRSSRPVYLKRVTRTGFEDGLFAAWRNDPTFVLNQPARTPRGSVLVAGPDFGTGSSREHAVWALHELRLPGRHLARASPTSSAATPARPGCSTAQVDQDDVERLWELLETEPGDRGHRRPAQRAPITAEDIVAPFEIDDYTRWRLLEGLDDIGLTLRHEADITAYEATRPAWKPTVTAG